MIKLEIGAGNRPQPGYVHHDVRPLDDIEVVCDAPSFPTGEKNKYDEVYAANILEQFNRFEVNIILREWVSLLKIGSVMRIVVPDIKEICRQYTNGWIDHEFLFICATEGMIMSSTNITTDLTWMPSERSLQKVACRLRRLSRVFLGNNARQIATVQ